MQTITLTSRTNANRQEAVCLMLIGAMTLLVNSLHTLTLLT